MTELSPVSHVSPCDDSIKHGSIGLLLPNLECKVSVYNARITDLLIWNDKNNCTAEESQKRHEDICDDHDSDEIRSDNGDGDGDGNENANYS